MRAPKQLLESHWLSLDLLGDGDDEDDDAGWPSDFLFHVGSGGARCVGATFKAHGHSGGSLLCQYTASLVEMLRTMMPEGRRLN